MCSFGLRINPAARPVAEELFRAYQGVVTFHISDNLACDIGARGLVRFNVHRAPDHVLVIDIPRRSSREGAAQSAPYAVREQRLMPEIATGATSQNCIDRIFAARGLAN